jgi:hypothetical protein
MAIRANSIAQGTLFVPIAVDVLVVNHLVAAQPFNRWRTDYDNLRLLKNPVPAPFESVAIEPPATGIHLHWALPDALTHGVQRDNGEIEFPHVPNRWLVARFGPPDLPLKAWVLESDYLNPSDGTSPFLDPFAPAGQFVNTQIGRSVPLDRWQGEPSSTAPLFLKALGPGDVTFAAFAPGVENVFGFVDDGTLADGKTPLTMPATLTYLVAGWYSDPTADPLHGWTTTEEWQSLMDALRWSVARTPDTPPKQSAYHGLVYGVDWQDTRVPERIHLDAREVSANVQVAVGNTAVDALVAYVARQFGAATPQRTRPVDMSRIEAFASDLLPVLDQPDGEAQIDQLIRQAWFGATDGGTQWEIVSAQRQDLASPEAAAAIAPTQGAWLAQLNTQQQQLDQRQRALNAMQADLYGLWWKHRLLQTGYTPQYPPDDFGSIAQQIAGALDTNQTSPPSFVNAVTTEQTQLTALAGSLPDPHDAVSVGNFASSMLDSSSLVLKPAATPRFYHPNDPVVLIAGLGRAQKHGEDGRYSDDGTMACRITGDTVVAITVKTSQATATISATATAIAASIPIAANPSLPAAIRDLCVEAFFLDPGNAATIAARGLNSTDPATISAVADAITNQTGFDASPPLPFAAAQWRQAWSPLFLEWQVSWQPTMKQDDDGTWHFDAEGWQFDGRDYVWTGGYPPVDAAKTFKGRTFLTPQVAFNFASRLKRSLDANADADLQALEDLLDRVDQWDFLSQTLSGLNAALVMRDVEQNVPPDASVAALVGEQYHAVPDVGAGDVDTSFGGAPPFFFPIRAGMFRFQKLQIVDCFGQVVDLMQANGNTSGNPDSFVPIRGDALSPAGSAVPAAGPLMVQPPRIIQPARLDFRFISAESDDTELTAGGTAVCGWLLPNHLDRAIGVYAANGDPLAEISLSEGVDWQPAPNSSSPLSGPGDISNGHLRSLLLSVSDPDAFTGFLRVIDETLCMANPLGGRADQNLSVLIGRPLALVRARLQLTLEADPLRDQSWGATFSRDSGDLMTTTFEVRLGELQVQDDGLMGYFDEAAAVFHAVHAPADMTPTPFITPIANGQYLPLRIGVPAFVTLLLDPLGSVHASTGILPAKTLTLPARWYADALAAMSVTFRVGPVLLRPGVVAMPRPAERKGAWSWIHRPDPGSWTEDPIVKATAGAQLADVPLAIAEGWMKLSTVSNSESDK